jgi:hypothetical protein
MDISKLKESIVASPVSYGGQSYHAEFKPDLLTREDMETKTVAEAVAVALIKWDAELDGEVLPINADTMNSVIPDGLLSAYWNKLLEIRSARLGKSK